jgi:hypothetical protein
MEVAQLKMLDMDTSLKNLLNKQVNASQSQPVYCTGFLKVAGIPELIGLATPTRVNKGH